MAGGDYNLGTAHGTIELNAASLGRASSALDHVANRLLLVGGAAVAGLGYAVKSAADFEQQMSRFGSVSNATKAEMESIRKKALQLGQDSAYGATEVITAFAELGYAGVTTKEILGGVGDAVVYLAAAAEIPLKDAATALVNTMRQFQIPAKGAKEAVNELARAANASTIDMADLITSMKYAGPVAAALHAPLNDVAETLALLGNNGIRGSTAGTSLRGILIALTPTSLKAQAEMQKLGLITSDAGQEFQDAEGNVVSLEQATAMAAATFKHKTAPSAETLRKEFKKLGLSAKEGSNLFFTAEGKMKSLAEISQILQDHTSGLTDEQKKLAFTIIFQRRAMASALILARGGKKAYDDLAHSAQYNTTAQELMKKKLDNLKGSFKIFMASLQTFAITIGEQLTPILKHLTDKLKDVTNWFIKLSPDTKKWIVLVVGSIGGLLLFAGVFLKIGKGLIGMYKALKDLGAGLKIVASIFKSTIVADPWILALVGIGLAIWYLYNASPRFRQFVKDFIKELGKLEVAFGGWIADTVGSPEAKRFLHDFLDTLGQVEVGFGLFILNTFGSPTAKKFLHDFLHQLGEVEVGFADFMLKTFGSKDAKTFLHDFLHTLGQVEVGFADFMLKTFGSKRAKVFLHDFLYELGKIEVGLVQLGGAFISFVAKYIGKFLGGLWSIVTTLVKIAVWIPTKGKDMMLKFLNGLLNGWASVENFFKALPDKIGGFLVHAITWLFDHGRDLLIGLYNGINDAIANLPGVMFGLFLNVISAIGDTGKWLINAGEHLVHGMWKGIKSAAGWLIEKIKGWVGDIVGAVEDFFGIHSPSRVFAEIGGHLARGLAMGIRDNAHLVQAAYSTLAPDAMNASLAYSVAGGKGAGIGGVTSVAGGAAARQGVGPDTTRMESHLKDIKGALQDHKDWGPPVVQVAAGVKNPTQVGLEAVRQMRSVSYRGQRRRKEMAA